MSSRPLRLLCYLCVKLQPHFHVRSYRLVHHHKFKRILHRKAGKMESVYLDEAIQKMKWIDPYCEILRVARAVGVTFGDSA